MVFKIGQKRQCWRICYTQLHASIKAFTHLRALPYHLYARSAVYHAYIYANIIMLGHATFLAKLCREFLFWAYSYGIFTTIIAYFLFSTARYSQWHTHLRFRKTYTLMDDDHASAFLPVFGGIAKTTAGHRSYYCLHCDTDFALQTNRYSHKRYCRI